MTTEINYAAVLDAPYAKLKLASRPIPTPGPKEIVVRNHAVAANPADVSIPSFNSILFGKKYVGGWKRYVCTSVMAWCACFRCAIN